MTRFDNDFVQDSFAPTFSSDAPSSQLDFERSGPLIPPPFEIDRRCYVPSGRTNICSDLCSFVDKTWACRFKRYILLQTNTEPYRPSSIATLCRLGFARILRRERHQHRAQAVLVELRDL
jgi:hypothetical protein